MQDQVPKTGTPLARGYNTIEVCGSTQRPAGRAGIISPLPDCGITLSPLPSPVAQAGTRIYCPLFCAAASAQAGHATYGINKTYESRNEKRTAGPTEPESTVYRCTGSSKVVQDNYSYSNCRANSSTFSPHCALQCDMDHSSPCVSSPLS